MDPVHATLVDELVIPAWANGPDGSANGGYAAGMLAQASGIHGAIEVSLRLPPPLDTPLRVVRGAELVELVTDDGGAHADANADGTADAAPRLVAIARAASLADLELPDAVRTVGLDAARTASLGFPYRDAHPFAHCLCCGIARDPAQPELAIHCGPVAGTALHADAWTPSVQLADPTDATIASIPAMWSALDCPSASPFADPDRPAVLARFEVELVGRARVGEPCVLVAWELARDGRKLHSASVLVASDGEVLGRARALWIEVRPT